MSKGEYFIHGSYPHADVADNAWKDYFKSLKDTGSSNKTLQLWGAAEGAGTTYGRLLAQEHGQTKSVGEMLFLNVGDFYRNGLKVRKDPSTMTPMVGSAYGWFFDTSSTIPILGQNVPPVSIVAYFLLQK